MFLGKKEFPRVWGLLKSLKKHNIKVKVPEHIGDHAQNLLLLAFFQTFFFLKTQLLIPKLMGIVFLDSKNSRVG